MFGKSFKLASLALAAFAVVATVVPALAQPVIKSLALGRPVTIAGQQVPKGDYSIRFIDDQDGELVIMKGSREVSKIPYKVVKLNHPAADTAVIYSVAADGSYRLNRLEFRGLNIALVLE
jgi:hypothetical protein